jgi:Rrf2 family protein
MLDLAMQKSEQPVPLRGVAHRQGISGKYLEQIVTQLTRSRLLRSVRGAGGGYCLTKNPEDYTVGEIIRTMEGSLAPVNCVNEGCCRADNCATREIWTRVEEAVSSVLDHVTLEELARRQSERDI